MSLSKTTSSVSFGVLTSYHAVLLGNLRTTTKSMTTTSVDWEKTGTRTSVLAGKKEI